MASKLTLYIDETIIESAKEYADNSHTSVSKIVEQFLRSIKPAKSPQKISPDIRNLRGVYKNSKNIDGKKILVNALKKKYL